MNKLEFIQKLYNGKNCYSDHMSSEAIELLHITSKAEELVAQMLEKGKIVFLTGNPGDGKTFIIRALSQYIEQYNAYVQTDLNKTTDYNEIVDEIIACYNNKRPAIIAANEYPFLLLSRSIRARADSIFTELMTVKKRAISYAIESEPLVERIAVIDLNERNMLDPDHHLLDDLLDRFLALLSEEEQHSAVLKHNLLALSRPEVKQQLLSLMRLATTESKHYAVRDILGAFAYMLTACTLDEGSDDNYYYSAIFSDGNELLREIRRYDPIYLSSPELDERLWNGEITEGWLVSVPNQWPKDIEEVDAAVECFKAIKRRLYFENTAGAELQALQPDEVKHCMETFNSFESQKRKIKERLIRAINKLFLPTSDEKRRLYIWASHRYDMSIEPAVAVSRKAVDASKLELLMPHPAVWLRGLEFVPTHIIMKPKDREAPVLELSTDFIRTLNAVENGYPVALLAPQYEQAAAMFLQRLNDTELAEDNDDDEIIIASRSRSFKQLLYIQDGKYGFEEDE